MRPGARVKLRIATRRSKLALTQTRWVGAELRRRVPELEVEELQIVTKGDRVTDVALAEMGGKGLFVAEIETAVLQNRADLAVHSLKDVPADLAEGLELVCFPAREDPRDVLVTEEGCQLDDLRAGDRVGTSSLRRRTQLQAIRPDLHYAVLRGNVDTRLRKLEQGEYRAIVLAHAGLRRLGLADRPLWVIPVDLLVPSVGQGALALEARASDADTRALVQTLEDAPTRANVEAERTFLRELGGDCHIPLAGHSSFNPGTARLRFDGLVASTTGTPTLRASAECYVRDATERALHTRAQQLARDVAASLLAQGADELIRRARDTATSPMDPRSKPSRS